MATVAMLSITISAWWWGLRVSRSLDVDEERNEDQIGLSKSAQIAGMESMTVTGSYPTRISEIQETWDGKIY